VGDFLTVSIDHDAKTIAYQNLTNGQQGTVSYTVASDGGYAIQDPQGNLVMGYEIPGYALVLELNNAGPQQNTNCLAFAIQQAPIDLNTMNGTTFNYMQFRTNSGGMEIGSATISTSTLATTSFWPYGNMNGGSAFQSGTMDKSLWQLDPSGKFLKVPEENNQYSYVFATSSGVFAVDTPNGNIIALKQRATKELQASDAGTYKAIVYGKTDASTNQNNQEIGASFCGKGVMVITAQGHVSVTDENGVEVVNSDLQPVVDKSYLVGPGKLQDSCHGLYTFRVSNAGEDMDVFVTFVEGALFVSSFVPGAGSTYSYLYGIGLKL